jgi:hypothetical protein
MTHSQRYEHALLRCWRDFVALERQLAQLKAIETRCPLQKKTPTATSLASGVTGRDDLEEC